MVQEKNRKYRIKEQQERTLTGIASWRALKEAERSLGIGSDSEPLWQRKTRRSPFAAVEAASADKGTLTGSADENLLSTECISENIIVSSDSEAIKARFSFGLGIGRYFHTEWAARFSFGLGIGRDFHTEWAGALAFFYKKMMFIYTCDGLHEPDQIFLGRKKHTNWA